MDLARLQMWAPLVGLAVAAGLNAVQVLRLRRSAAAEVISEGAASPTKAGESPTPPVSLKALLAGARDWALAHRLETALLVVGALIGVYVWTASPELTVPAPRAGLAPAPPYRALHYVRELQLRWAGILDRVVGIAGTAVGLACFAVSRRKGDLQAARVGLLAVGLAVLCLWQLSMLRMYSLRSSTVLLFGLVVLLAWALDYRPRAVRDLFGPLPGPSIEIALLTAALTVTVVARFAFLDRMPYGIEGDELKWTVEVVRSMLDGEFLEAAEYHLTSLPVSFFMQLPFLRLFGPGIVSARMATAFYSLLGSLAFYGLVRRVVGARVAWLATFLLGISLLDVSASRHANVESLVKLWPMAALFVLAWALDTRRTAGFVAAGALVAIGLLTYDTVAPLLVAGLILLIYDLRRLGVPRGDAFRYAAAFLGPQLLVLPAAATYWVGRWQYYELANKGLESNTPAVLARHAAELWHSLFAHARPDFFYNRNGPLFQSLLSPWLLIGLLLALLLWRRGRLMWPLVVLGLFFLPVPILARSAMGRVLYPGLPAAYLMMAIGMVAGFGEIRRWLGSAAGPLVTTAAGVALVQLAILNQYISFNEVFDQDERRAKRELYEIAGEIQDSGAVGIFPYLPAAGDPLEAEREYAIWLGMRSRVGSYQFLQKRISIPASSLLATVSSLGPIPEGVAVVWNTSDTLRQDERDELLATFLRCYPSARRHAGVWFDWYSIDAQGLAAPECGSADVDVELAPGSPHPAGLVEFEWSVTGASPRDVTLLCGQQDPALRVLQAETLSGPGWVTETRFAVDYQGEGFLADPGGSTVAPATTQIEVPEPSDYFVWVRSYRRVEDTYPALLTIDGQTAEFAARFTGQAEWIWERLGPFPVRSSFVDLSIARPYGGPPDRFMALFFDVIVITSRSAFSPESDDPYEIVLRRTFPNRAGAVGGTIGAELPPGAYACWIVLQGDERLIDPWGRPGVRSLPVHFTVPEA